MSQELSEEQQAEFSIDTPVWRNTNIKFFNIEKWLEIPNYPNYFASNIGRIKRIFRGVDSIKKQIITKNGYLQCSPSIDGLCKPIKVHRLIAFTFIENPENKPMINHINGIKTDNRIENLEWCTAKENISHAKKTGLIIQTKGEAHRSKLTQKQVLEIRRLLASGYSQAHLSKLFNISAPTISNIYNRTTWNHI